MPPLPVVIEEKEVLVLDQRSAECAAKLVHMEGLAWNAARVVDPSVGVQVAVAEDLEGRTVELIGAGLGYHVDHRAAGPPEFGGVTVAVHLELFHRIDAELVR